jgi:GT2 family glycosyltransferase
MPARDVFIPGGAQTGIGNFMDSLHLTTSGQLAATVQLATPGRPQASRLAACIEALAALDYGRDRFEVIVVDGGSEMGLEPVVSPFRRRLSLTLLEQSNAGPAAARNTGAARARGRFLAFTDDDCLPAPGWLRALEAAFAAAPGHAVGSRTLNALPDCLFSTASQVLVTHLYAYYNANAGRARFLASNNLAVPADRFLAVGAFSTMFRLAAGEDREFCDRWLRHGYPMTYAPAACVHHAHALTFRTFWRQHFN